MAKNAVAFGTPSPRRTNLDSLRVIDRLEVGTPKLTPRGMSATYRILQGRRSDALDLAYRYPEEVFEPGETASENLAAMMAAQVALNYGLFCREIRFAGSYDFVDRRFIEEMARHTAREIYVKKFLEPNPFIRGQVGDLPARPKMEFLQARLIFSGPDPSPRTPAREEVATPLWTPIRSRHAVLSSGGKDSLLTFGLLREMNRETHPIFLNESGRHWYTALNAYRHFQRKVPEAARVWTNSDRIFTWMLRHFPFIRSDFSRIRSDEYPIRLWTVAVFLFGALPLVRKRGIGRILIGDEFDTTRRTTHRGIPHYDGLYDQSRYFDNAMSRYYRRKGWGCTQFSLLRPLSELLIQKILAVRYPELQKHQVSCHAAHLEGRRVLPCGRCEKCRRIVAMLVGVGVDPRRCGFRKEMVDRCLKEFARRGASQESRAVRHLTWLLAGRGRLPASGTHEPAGGQKAPEITRIRLDRERSRIEEIPLDLRRPLIEIFLRHADGAVRRRGRVWVPVDPANDPMMLRPNPFETPPPRTVPAQESAARMRSADYLLAEMTWPAARRRFQETDVALLPVGSTEQHGPHLPLDTDAWDAEYLARRVAAGCRPPRPFVFPLIPYGVSYHHEEFSGTLSVSPEALSRMVYDVGMSAARHGITKLVIINGHGGNVPTLQFAAQKINRDAHVFTCVDTGETSDADVARIIQTPNDVHAGEVETSTALATRPELVDRTQARKFIPRFSSQYLEFSTARSVEWYARTHKISRSGVLGDPTRASREKGQRIWKVMIEHLIRFVESLKGMSLDEIYQRKY